MIHFCITSSDLLSAIATITINIITLLKYHSLARLVKDGNSRFDNDVNWMSAATPK
ncbi:hypothetical protein HUN01_32125 [Nostoc edaphicum CCNP1411]|uniref:Uncharacterized protein n=2 Tax=Nostoc TaxID=1177 RepID=A0A7D7QRD9_9NOSO|nr:MULTISPECIES: hypothetical protein [Nostoc]QMS92025.1 hypothetical protein HUN01_32125 [Nostoc edaphicum CCNP1411]